MSGMAEVLAAWNFDQEQGEGEWVLAPERVKCGWIKDAKKTLDFLAAAGFGPVKGSARRDRVNQLVIQSAEAEAVKLSDRGEEWAALTIIALLSIIEDLDQNRIAP